MILDTSAVVAVVRGEPQSSAILERVFRNAKVKAIEDAHANKMAERLATNKISGLIDQA